MEQIIRHFSELHADELYEIIRLREEVFVVEQQCIYLDADGRDTDAWHVMLRDEDGLAAYCRVLAPGVSFPEASLGRVIAKKRMQGLGTQVVALGIQVAVEKYHASAITIEAQTYARTLYEKLGFRQNSEEFLEDGIPHIRMEWKA